MNDARFDIEWRWTERRAELRRVHPPLGHPHVKQWVRRRLLIVWLLYVALGGLLYVAFFWEMSPADAALSLSTLLGGLLGGVFVLVPVGAWVLSRIGARRIFVERPTVVERTLSCSASLRVSSTPAPVLALDVAPGTRGQILEEREVQGSASTAIAGAQSAVPTPTIDLERAVVHMARNPAGEVVAEFRQTRTGDRLGVVVGRLGPTGAAELPLMEREAAHAADTAGFLDALVPAADAAGLRLPAQIRRLEAIT